MAKVDSKGRILLPKHLRERLGINPGTEVEITEQDGTAVVQPEKDPEHIISRMNELIDEAASNRELRTSEDFDEYAQDHAEIIRRQAAKHADDE
ncbi:AbrB/MazE/SpoVT family DNA-binding domain-containing protein [Haladaptatus sp. GCM10025707]|uniref:AbrB/MazE/SpoVT family DNA-binding domain-containing protein n=1 Tax=unclassified Haladaptatus TaxID=2622732 RepID=UPI0023E8B6D8|nr:MULTISPECIES: AbrB/MazE/SpoVT family DNA-binding domain-containing protein [unclassified Haladaptatus]